MKNVYVADFETTTEETYLKDGETRVWAACVVTVEENPKVVHLSNNIEDFMQFVSKENCHVYFHNLKFDGEFILYWLMHNGYKFNREHDEKTFDVMVSDMGAWYELTAYHKKYNRKYLKTTFYDSLKKLPLRVEQIAKAFDLPISKLEIDYDEYREPGHELTDHEKEYVINDCVIVAKALHHQFTEGLKKLTIGSDALANFKEILGPTGWKYLFPTLPLDYDNDIRKSYRGGWCYVNERYRNKRLSGISFDVNSLYPSVMYGLHGKLPYGTPVLFNGEYVPDDKYPLYIQKVSCRIRLKEGHLPTIQLKNNRMFASTEYITDSKGIVDLTLTSVDFEQMLEHYHVTNLEYVGGYKYKAADTIFRQYIDYWAKIKAESTGGKRQLAKLMLNSLYGKFATNPIRQAKIPIMEEDEIKFIFEEEKEEKPVYTALASFVTAYARQYTITAAQRYYDRFIYADTDSITLVGYDIPDDLDIHDTELGKWGNEGEFEDSIFLKPKTYLKVKRGKMYVTCAGMPDRIHPQVTFENFTYNTHFPGNLRPQRVKGGVILAKKYFTIKPIKGVEVGIKEDMEMSEKEYNLWCMEQLDQEDKLLKVTETMAAKQYFCYKCGTEIHKHEHVKRVHIPPKYDRATKKTKFYKPITLCYNCEIHRLSEIELYEEKAYRPGID